MSLITFTRNPRMEAFRTLLTRGIEVMKCSTSPLTARRHKRVLFLHGHTLYLAKHKQASDDAKRFELAEIGSEVRVEDCDEISNFKLIQKWYCLRNCSDKDLNVELNVATYFCKEKLVCLLQQLLEQYSQRDPNRNSASDHTEKNSESRNSIVENPLSVLP